MWPGNTLLIQEYRTTAQVGEGDIVLYNTTGQRIAHRVVAAYPGRDQLVVKPDNQDRKHDIQYDDVEYVVVGILWN